MPSPAMNAKGAEHAADARLLAARQDRRHRKAILDGLYHAMRETFEVPEHDRFMTISQHDEDEFSYGAEYLGIERQGRSRHHSADR